MTKWDRRFGRVSFGGSDEHADDREATAVRGWNRDGHGGGEGKLVLNVLLHAGMREIELPAEGVVTIGRAPDSDIQVEHRSVSRNHARLTIEAGGRVVVEDLASSNGTFVNNESVEGTAPRQAGVGDMLRFGGVTAHLMEAHTPHSRRATHLEPSEFDRRVLYEAERALRFNRRCSVLSLLLSSTPAEFTRAREAVQNGLRELDLYTSRAAGDLDVIVTECDRDDARALAERLHQSLSARGMAARVGVATFPGDAPSPGLLIEAAHLAAASRDEPGVTAAGEATRIFRISDRDVVVADPEMQRIYARIERTAPTDLSVLVTGETGSGKEIVAEAIHALSPRAGRPLVKINCAAIPENLLESELFGHERGAFTGAASAKPGLFEQASGGTVFLDEIGEMRPELQAKLLRVLEDQVVRRVGGVKDTAIDVRVVSATHRDLRQDVEVGRFRQDLFYRLNGVAVHVPPLRDRRSEIPLFAKQFIARACRKAGRKSVAIGEQAAAALQAYSWPGNIRELRHAVEQAALLCQGSELMLDDLPDEVRGASSVAAVRSRDPVETTATSDEPQAADQTAQFQLSLDEELRGLERRRILEALERTGGNQTQAAKLLGLPRKTLVSKMASLGISRPRRDEG